MKSKHGKLPHKEDRAALGASIPWYQANPRCKEQPVQSRMSRDSQSLVPTRYRRCPIHRFSVGINYVMFLPKTIDAGIFQPFPVSKWFLLLSTVNLS